VEEDRSKNQRSYALAIPFGSAKATRTNLRGGLEISGYEGVLSKPLSLRFQTMYPHLEISYTMSGYGNWSGDGTPGFEMAPGISTLAYMADRRLDAELSPAEPLSHMEVRIDLRCFEALNSELSRRSPGGFFSRQLASHPQIVKLFEQIRDCSYAGPLRQLYLEGKCYELIATFLDQTGSAELSGTRRSKLTPEDIRCLHLAREVLVHSWRTPPSLLELARSAGINDYKLKAGFKELFGTTVFGYIRHLRLNEARRLLEGGEATVSQAAFRVGYLNMSHFAVAYRKEFGYNPSECIKEQRKDSGENKSASR
jgi:AraC-like DNA-binding protein